MSPSRVPLALVLALAALPSAAPATERVRPRPPPRPAPSRCQDPIQGVWVARKHIPRVGGWRTFTFTIRRTAPGAPTITGSITNRAWSGDARQSSPPACSAGELDVTVEQPASGTFDNNALDFEGSAWRIAAQACSGWSTYHLDHFTGTLDPAQGVLRTVNNDGRVDIDEPFVFRRARCL